MGVRFLTGEVSLQTNLCERPGLEVVEVRGGAEVHHLQRGETSFSCRLNILRLSYVIHISTTCAL